MFAVYLSLEKTYELCGPQIECVWTSSVSRLAELLSRIRLEILMYVNKHKLTSWTNESVLDLLQSSDSFLEHCLLLLHSRQTELEKLAHVTINKNEAGMQQADALCFSLYAEKLNRGEHLSDVEIACCKIPWHRGERPVIRIGKYRKQLVRIFEAQAHALFAPR